MGGLYVHICIYRYTICICDGIQMCLMGCIGCMKDIQGLRLFLSDADSNDKDIWCPLCRTIH